MPICEGMARPRPSPKTVTELVRPALRIRGHLALNAWGLSFDFDLSPEAETPGGDEVSDK